MKISLLQYPWLSTLIGLLLVAVLYATTEPELSGFYAEQLALLQPEYKFAAMLLFFAAVIFDTHRFGRRKTRFDRQLKSREQQIKELLKAKNTLQHKVHKYSDHADKLKLFISDRLLEYIEYDEKFLHFKNIASEVRHNGVICYDKVSTALQRSLEECKPEQAGHYQDALASMTYLWDLLDLSTTDNIAIYIANKLYESEEQYYQQLLNDDGAPPPYSPTYPTRLALGKSLRAFVEQPDTLQAELASDNDTLRYEDSRFLVELNDAGNLLGNENYLILLAENLVNNALYYAGSRKNKSKHARIQVRLAQEDQRTVLSIYNPGPTISAENTDKIFQLGFSTKRVKEHNGKGLGLYFVNEIVKGYEGEIHFTNLHNRPDVYVIRAELENGAKLTEIINTELDENGLPQCLDPQTQERIPLLEKVLDDRIKNLDVAIQSTQQTYSLGTIADGKKTSLLLDPRNPAHPQWCLEVTAAKKHHKLSFKALDVSGVEFTVQLPTAESRLDADYHARDSKALTDIDQLDQDFERLSQPYQ